MNRVMYLSSCSFVEPEEPLLFYCPSWLNVWESHLYKNALKSTATNSWGFKRFGTTEDTYIREACRKPNYIAYINAMEKASDQALHELSTKERMLLFKSRTAFIYVDSWGESGTFEYDITALHLSFIDTLPKNLVKKFSVDDVTCKIRGEKNSLVQAMRLAQDYLNWNIFDFVIICGAYRAIPILTFSNENSHHRHKVKRTSNTVGINLSIERVGCFIFSQRESPLKVNCGPYVDTTMKDRQKSQDQNTHNIDLIAVAGEVSEHSRTSSFNGKTIDLEKLYGPSGCLTPALSWQYIAHRSLSGGCIRTILPIDADGYTYFDTWY